MSREFLRRNWNKYKRLGLGRRKKQIWRRPKGKHSKTRKRRKGYPPRVEPGYRTPRKERGMILGKQPIIVRSLRDLGEAGEELIILGHVGKRKRNLLLKKIEEKNLSRVK